jgi:hypothetical protein
VVRFGARQEASSSASSFGVNWKVESQRFRKKYRMGDTSPWCSRRDVELKGVPDHDRHRDLIDCVWAAATFQAHTEDIPKITSDLGLDVSQSLSFRPWFRGSLPTMTTSANFYLYGHDRVMLEEEKFRVLGFGKVKTGRLTATQLRDLTGEAMAVYSISGVAYAMALGLQYPGLFSR